MKRPADVGIAFAWHRAPLDTSTSPLSNVSQRLDLEQDLLRGLVGRIFPRVDSQVRIDGGLVWVVDPCEIREQPGTSLGVEALAVAFLAHVNRRRHMHLDEAAGSLD